MTGNKKSETGKKKTPWKIFTHLTSSLKVVVELDEARLQPAGGLRALKAFCRRYVRIFLSIDNDTYDRSIVGNCLLIWRVKSVRRESTSVPNLGFGRFLLLYDIWFFTNILIYYFFFKRNTAMKAPTTLISLRVSSLGRREGECCTVSLSVSLTVRNLTRLFMR